MKALFLRKTISIALLLLFINFAIKAQPDGQISAGAPQSTAPDIHPIHPPIDFSVHPPPSKFSEVTFAEPQLESKTLPRTFKATAYSLRGRTASGIQTRPGIVAADPRVLPLGSVVEIKAGSYSGVYTVHDTGGKVKGNLIDVWLPSSKEALQFGRRKIKLQVLRYGPANSVKQITSAKKPKQ